MCLIIFRQSLFIPRYVVMLTLLPCGHVMIPYVTIWPDKNRILLIVLFCTGLPPDPTWTSRRLVSEKNKIPYRLSRSGTYWYGVYDVVCCINGSVVCNSAQLFTQNRDLFAALSFILWTFKIYSLRVEFLLPPTIWRPYHIWSLCLVLNLALREMAKTAQFSIRILSQVSSCCKVFILYTWSSFNFVQLAGTITSCVFASLNFLLLT